MALGVPVLKHIRVSGQVIPEERSSEFADGRTTKPTYYIHFPGAFGSYDLKCFGTILNSDESTALFFFAFLLL